MVQMTFKTILKQMDNWSRTAPITTMEWRLLCGLHSVRRANSWNSCRRQDWKPWQWSQENLPLFVQVRAQVRQLKHGPFRSWSRSTRIQSLRVWIFAVYASFKELMCAQSFSAGPSLRFMVLTRWSSVRSSRACPSISWERNSWATSWPPGEKTA